MDSPRRAMAVMTPQRGGSDGGVILCFIWSGWFAIWKFEMTDKRLGTRDGPRNAALGRIWDKLSKYITRMHKV
jgi:hypothetical protein